MLVSSRDTCKQRQTLFLYVRPMPSLTERRPDQTTNYSCQAKRPMEPARARRKVLSASTLMAPENDDKGDTALPAEEPAPDVGAVLLLPYGAFGDSASREADGFVPAPAAAEPAGEPAPGEPAPGEPAPGEPAPGEPAPGEPAPEPEPGAPEPLPEEPEPGEPGVPEPGGSDPDEPEPLPGEPEPGEPDPLPEDPGVPDPAPVPAEEAPLGPAVGTRQVAVGELSPHTVQVAIDVVMPAGT